MEIAVQPLREADAESLVAAEDDETVHWLIGRRSTVAITRDYVRRLAAAAAAGSTKRAFAIWVDGECVGSADFDADPQDGIGPGDVNISYAVAPWVRGRGITTAAVGLLCRIIRERGVGTRAVIRCDARNPASVRVAQKAGFRHDRDILSDTDADAEGRPTPLQVYVLDLEAAAHAGA